jgi:hypothetical protein
MGFEEGVMTRCPRCRLSFCRTYYLVHRKMEKMAPLLANPMIPRKTGETRIWDSAFTTSHHPMTPIPRLRDGQGTPAPAAANPFIFKRGTGRPDEPPEAADAPNRPKKMITVYAS